MHGSCGVVSGWLHVTVTVTLSAPYCAFVMLSVGVYGISIVHVIISIINKPDDSKLTLTGVYDLNSA